LNWTELNFWTEPKLNHGSVQLTVRVMIIPRCYHKKIFTLIICSPIYNAHSFFFFRSKLSLTGSRSFLRISLLNQCLYSSLGIISCNDKISHKIIIRFNDVSACPFILTIASHKSKKLPVPPSIIEKFQKIIPQLIFSMWGIVYIN
jgi:hypothetical protein